MEQATVLVTPRSFGLDDPEIFDLFKKAEIVVKRNNSGAVLSRADMQRQIQDCIGVIVGIDPLDEPIMAKAPYLRAIAKYGTGLDNIDLQAAKNRGIAVSNTIGANSDAVADYTFALILSLARQVPVIDANCHQGNWKKLVTSDVHGKTLGLLGFGEIGKRVARRAQGFAMRVLVHDITWQNSWEEQYGVHRADPDSIFEMSDFISLHMPLSAQTRQFVNSRRISRMKSSSFLINTARGELVDEKALLEALISKRIAGAGIDTFQTEPPLCPEWYSLNNVIMGSHCAASTREATRNMGRFALKNLLLDLGMRTVVEQLQAAGDLL